MKFTYTLFMLLLLSICLNANAQIVNEGDLKISTNTTVYFGDEYTNKATGNHQCDGDLYLNYNFINHGKTSATSGTTFFKSATNRFIEISGTAKKVNFYNLEINVFAPRAKGVSVLNNLKLQINNKVQLKHGKLKLIGKSQLIQTSNKP